MTVDFRTAALTAIPATNYSDTSGTLTFTNGQSSANFLVSVLNNTNIQGNVTVQLLLTNAQPVPGLIAPGAAYLGTNAIATLIIVDDDFAPGSLSFSSATFLVNENGTNATITVTRTNGFTGLVTVRYNTANGTALGYSGVGPTAGFNYTNTSGTLTFADGELVQTFRVGVIDDTAANGNKTVNLLLSNPTGGAQLGAIQTAVLTIVDDELSNFGSLVFSTNAYTVSETNGSVLVTVQRLGGSAGTVTVDFIMSGGTAIPGLNYLNATRTLTLTNGVTNSVVAVTVLNNPILEGDKTVNLSLANATGGATIGNPAAAVLTITDNGSAPGEVHFSTGFYGATENGTNATITVVRSNGFTGAINVDVRTVDGTALAGRDYSNTVVTLSFSNSQRSATLLVPIINNAAQDGNRIFSVQLFNFAGGALPGLTNATVRILDDERPAGSLDDQFNPGGTGPDGVVYAVQTEPNGLLYLAGDFTAYNGTNRSALARLNVNGTLDALWDAGAITRVGTNGSVRALGLYTSGTNIGKVVIAGLFDNVAGFGRAHIARVDGVTGAIDPSFDPGAGANSPIYAVAIQTDGKVLIGGSFSVFAGAQRSGVARLNLDGTLDGTFNPGSGANGSVRALAVDINGLVYMAGDFTSVDGVGRNRIARLKADGSVDKLFDPGTGADNFVNAIALPPDGRPYIAGGFGAINGTARARIARLGTDGALDGLFDPGSGFDDYVTALALQPDGRLVAGGAFTVVRGLPRNRIVRLDAAGAVDPTINIGDGADNFVATVAVQNDGKIILGGGFTNFNGVVANRLARLFGGTNLGPGSLNFLSPAFAVVENGTNVVITVVREGGTLGPVGVDYATSDGNAVAPQDYVAAAGTLTFLDGETRKSFTVTIVDNVLVDGNRTVNLALGNPTGGSTIGAVDTAVLTILDNDGVVGFSPASYNINENAGVAVISVVRAGGATGQVSVDYFTRDGSAVAGRDYVATNGTVVFGPGQSNGVVTVGIIDNITVEGNRVFEVVLTNVTGAAVIGLTNAPVTIIDNEFGPGTVTFVGTNFVVGETATNGVAVITVLRTNGSVGPVSVRFGTADGTGTNGAHYIGVSGQFNWADGDNSVKTFNVTILNDGGDERGPDGELDVDERERGRSGGNRVGGADDCG